MDDFAPWARAIEAFARDHALTAEAADALVDLIRHRLAHPDVAPPSTTVDDGRPPSTLLAGDDDPSRSVIAGAAPQLESRYTDRGLLGVGGMADVRRVHDRVLNRELALKVLRLDRIDSVEARRRFLAEAQITAQLQHPGVVAVHECGELPDGRPWFTMKIVRGRTLAEAIEDHLGGAPDAPTIRRLIEVFGRVCRTIAYAHAKSVVHRDLKPANIMLGQFGEVLVLDWGVARLLGADPVDDAGSGAPEPPVSVGEDVRGNAGTRYGRVIGTPAYMAPEQARGHNDRLSAAADVYALGAVLYHILAGVPPYRGSSVSALAGVITGPPPPIESARRGRNPVPADLIALCERAMDRDPAARPTAEGLAAEVEDWLDGVRKLAQARRLVAEADTMVPRIARLRGEVAALERRAAERLDPLPRYAPVEQKREGWALEDEARRCEREAQVLEAGMLQTLRSALNVVPDLPEALERVAAFYQRRLLEAEARRDANLAAVYASLMRAHDRGPLTEWLEGDGRLTLITDPPGASVTLWRYEARDRRLVEVRERWLGATPLRSVPVPRGSHLLTIEADGCEPVRYPIDIGRGTHWDGIRPTERTPHVIRLPRIGELAPGEIYVPAGFCVVGGDARAVDAVRRRRVWIDGFVIGRDPVTNGEYLEFIEALRLDGREADALKCAPCELPPISGSHPRMLYARDPDGRFRLGVDTLGWRWQPDWPVVYIDWRCAMAYTEWLSGRTGHAMRPCHGMEHEKAARGVDGRPLPWGDHFDPTWANVLESHAGPPTLRAVGAVPGDVSPYGVRDTVGNVRSWCCAPYHHDGGVDDGGRLEVTIAVGEGTREIRGGAWHSAPYLCHAAGRFGAPPHVRYAVLGLRVARPFP